MQRIDVRLSIASVILLIALWSLAKKELEEEAMQSVSGNAGSAGPLEDRRKLP